MKSMPASPMKHAEFRKNASRERTLEERHLQSMVAAMGTPGRIALCLPLVVLLACDRRETIVVGASAHAQSNTAPRSSAPAAPRPHVARSGCDRPVPVYENGRENGAVCADDAAAEHLTVVDLSNDWAPWVFDGHEGQPAVRYRPNYIRLADERATETGDAINPEEQNLELYGVFPTFRVLRARSADQEVRQCHAGIDDEPLRSFAGIIHRRNRQDLAASPNLVRTADSLRRQLQAEATRRHLTTIDELASDTRMGAMLERYREADGWIRIIRTVQAHLRCDRMLGRATDGVFDQATSRALTTWQRRNMLVSKGYFDEHSRDFMLLSSDERGYQAMLRTLRERVVDATGLIEDGSAAASYGKVFGRDLNAPEIEATAVLGALPNAAPDRISETTEAAARALGFTDPAATFAWLDAHPDLAHTRVAVPLPALPPYYSEHMDLRAEIDRGDVRRGRNEEGDRRPNTTVFVRYEGRDIPLVRWSTTIGGYQSELLPDGTIGTRYKESPAGPRIWRDVVAAPAWMPPPTTPDDELVSQGRPNRSLVGPGYRSAYGLLMVMHHEVLPPGRDGLPRFRDEGVRSHGSVSYHSILGGFSHGCHRLFNHLALRLGGFLVRHRHHAVRGPMNVEYARTLLIDGAEQSLRVDSRGYLYELTPPVEMNVLEGTVHGRRR